MRQHLFISNFKKSVKPLALLLIFIAIIIFSIFIIGQKFYYASTQNKINVFSRQRFEEFYKSKALDLIFVGSSHSYCTFDPEVFNSKLNLNSYQLGMPSQTPDSTYYTLLEVLNYQEPKIIVMELYYLMLATDFDMKQFDQLFQFLNNPGLKEDYIKNVFPNSAKAKYTIPTIHYQADFLNYWNARLVNFLSNEFNLTQDIKQSNGTEYYRSLGYVYCDHYMDDEDIADTKKSFSYDGENFEFSERQLLYLQKIVELCDERGVRLFFVTAPISNAAFDNIDNYGLMYEKIAGFCESAGVNYVDYNIVNRDRGLLAPANFRDRNHVNDSGAKIISGDYSNYLD
ncbi:MAG: hypothetical protein LBV08_00015 [Clostridiales bacterium]|jgi:hypothetical protein|nr:hypothetical protein [Clostridiales bacterium]